MAEPAGELESVCKPDSVIGSHLSGTRVTPRLWQPTRKLSFYQEGSGSLPGPTDLPSCLALLPTGVAWPRRLPGAPVVSYTTFSPLPDLAIRGGLFLWPCPRVTPTGRYPALYPVESGLSSPRRRITPQSATT